MRQYKMGAEMRGITVCLSLCVTCTAASLAHAQYTLSPAEQALLRQADERIARVRNEGHLQQQRDLNTERNAGRCAQLEVDRHMLEDQIRRTGWQLEQNQAKARLRETHDKMQGLGCR